MDRLKTAFCWLYTNWMKHAVGSKDSLVVRVLDKLFGSECRYCMSVRTLIAGVGIGVLLRGEFWSLVFGVGLVAVSLALTYGERNWLCELEGKQQ